jgi:hypothetical protein
VDPALLAFLSRARSAHHIADQREGEKSLEAATAPLQALIDGPVPGGAVLPPEAREVLADTRARLADLQSQLNRFDDASANIEQGLKLATELTYFRGHLFEVRGLVEERRAKFLETQGSAGEAAAATRAALEAFEQSMKIQSQVIQETVPGSAPK